MIREFDFATADRKEVARHFVSLGHSAQRLSCAINEVMNLADARFLHERARGAAVIGQVRGGFARDTDIRLRAITRRIEDAMFDLRIYCGRSAFDAVFVMQALSDAAVIQRGLE